jgi:RNA polymerase sigma factor (sigma-70 family)
VLTRRYGDFDAAEDAVQEALLAAAVQWPREGLPDNPRGWLIQVAARRMADQVRSDVARRRREDTAARDDTQEAAPADADPALDRDDTLTLLFLCCHPSLTPASAIALTLRSVGGLTTAEIASAFLVPEATMAQRISRAKQTIKKSGLIFQMPTGKDLPPRLAQVLHVLYLIFNEGNISSSAPDPHRIELSQEAIRLARAVHRLLPDDTEVTGLLALMLLTDARRPARTGPGGELIPLTEQDRSRWDTAAIEEGVALITDALSRGTPGPYQLQAAIAAVHDEAAKAGDTDWPQILALYGVLESISDNPVVSLNRAVAVAQVHGPQAGLDLLETLEDRLAGSHRFHAVKGHLLAEVGDLPAAIEQLRTAAARTTSPAERHYLTTRAAHLAAEAEAEA